MFLGSLTFSSRETDFIPIRRLQLDVHRIEWSLYLPRLPRFEYWIHWRTRHWIIALPLKNSRPGNFFSYSSSHISFKGKWQGLVESGFRIKVSFCFYFVKLFWIAKLQSVSRCYTLSQCAASFICYSINVSSSQVPFQARNCNFNLEKLKSMCSTKIICCRPNHTKHL